MKRCKKIGVNFDFYLGVIDLLKSDLNLKQISKKLGMSRQNLNYYIRPLKVLNIIERAGYGVWRINEKNIAKLQYVNSIKEVKKQGMVGSQGNVFTSSPNQVRSHGYVFTLKIPNIKNWHRRIEFLEKKKVVPKEMKGGCSISYGNYKIHLFNGSIVIYFPPGRSYYSDRPIFAFLRAFYDCKQIIFKLEKLFQNQRFSIQGEYWLKPSRHHYALIHNEFAQYADKNKLKIQIRDHKGKVWLLVDNSFNLHETEFIHEKHAIKDTENFQPFFNLIRENPKILEDLKQDNDEMVQRIKDLSESQMNTTILLEQFDKNLKLIIDKMPG